MPRRASEEERDVRTRIEREGLRLFCRKGYVATSVQEIVAAAGVTKPVLYYYFGNKAGLFHSLLAGALQAFQGMTAEILGQPSGLRERLVGLAERNFAFCRAHPELLRFLLYALFAPEQGIPEVRFPELHRIQAGLFGQVLEEARAAGELGTADSEEAGLHFIGALHLLLVKRLREPDFPLDRGTAERLVDRYLDGVGNKSAEETEP
jgi:AcrR family transcriptional regulator